MKFCFKCGSKINKDDKFCFSCGANLKEVQHDIRTDEDLAEEITLRKRDKRVSKRKVEPLETKPTEIDKHQSRQASLDDRPASRNDWIIFGFVLVVIILSVVLVVILDTN